MMGERIIGHGKIVEHLRRRASRRNLAHAYIFAGPESMGKRQIAIGLAKSLLCSKGGGGKRIPGTFDFCNRCSFCEAVIRGTHPDFISISHTPEEERLKRDITIGEIRQLRRRLHLRSGFGGYKIILIESADRMTAEAANALLKVLEEPRGQVVFILITAHPYSILPTVRSRAEIINFRPVSQREIVRWLEAKGFSSTQALGLARISLGRPGEALTLVKDPTKQEQYGDYAATLRNLLNSSLGERMLFAEQKKDDEEGLRVYLRTWTIFLRDVLLKRLNLECLIVFPKELIPLEPLLAKYSTRQLARAVRLAERSLIYFDQTTAQPRFIMEYFLLHI